MDRGRRGSSADPWPNENPVPDPTLADDLTVAPDLAPSSRRRTPTRIWSGAAGSGDTAAWELLVARYQRLVFSVALYNGVSPRGRRRRHPDHLRGTARVHRLHPGRRATGVLADERRAPPDLAGAPADRERERPGGDLVGGTESGPDQGLGAAGVSLYDGLGRLPARCRDLLLALYFDPTEPSYERWRRGWAARSAAWVRCAGAVWRASAAWSVTTPRDERAA